LVGLAVLLSACRAPSSRQVQGISYNSQALNVDGRLDEQVYGTRPFTTELKPASRSGVAAPETKAWLWWNEGGLLFAFDARDERIASAPPGQDEHAVDLQDRAELFLWPEASQDYFCVEISPSGAVHDYSARIYRRFDDAWSPAGARFAARPLPGGYAVEGFLPLSALRRMGVSTWKAGTSFQLGLFRADFDPSDTRNPLWLTWIDPRLPQADFHVRGAFAPVILLP